MPVGCVSDSVTHHSKLVARYYAMREKVVRIV